MSIKTEFYAALFEGGLQHDFKRLVRVRAKNSTIIYCYIPLCKPNKIIMDTIGYYPIRDRIIVVHENNHYNSIIACATWSYDYGEGGDAQRLYQWELAVGTYDADGIHGITETAITEGDTIVSHLSFPTMFEKVRETSELPAGL